MQPVTSKAFTGVNGIPVTPFKGGGDIDYVTLTAIVRRMARAGVDVIVACGNTSEYGSLSSAEAVAVAHATIDAAEGCSSLVGVGGDIPTAVAEAQAAVARGASGVMVHCPSSVYASDGGLVEYYGRIASAVNAPIVLYVRERVMSFAVLEKVFRLENVVAVKYAVADALGFGAVVREFGSDVVALCGLAEMWAPLFYLFGAQGFTSGLVNVAPELSLAMWSELRAGDIEGALKTWETIRPFEELRARHDNALNVSVVKAAMVLRGLLRDASVRPPITAVSQTEFDEVRRVLDAWRLGK